MATVKEFKEWLNRFPDDTIIEVGFQQKAGNFESYGPVIFDTLKLSDSDYGDGWDFSDFRNNIHTSKNSPHFNKCFLSLGSAY